MTSNVNWRKFSEALALTLSGMPARAFLVINATEGRYARFHVFTPELWCEIVHNSQLGEDRRMPEESETMLRQAGWYPPVEGRSISWHRMVTWPVHYREYEVVADQVTSVLHQVLGVGDPTELDIESWIEDSDETFGIAALLSAVGG
ncbi:TY-Chap domain-containing protein [Nocardia sp. R16R-3T]